MRVLSSSSVGSRGRIKVKGLSLLYLLFIFGFPLFYYTKELYPFYALSKGVFPILAFAISGTLLILRGRLSVDELLIWGVTTTLVLLATIQTNKFFDQSIWISLSGQIKLLPAFYYLPTLALLRGFDVKEDTLIRVVRNLSVLLLTIYTLITLTIPPEEFLRLLGVTSHTSIIVANTYGRMFYQFPQEILYFGYFVVLENFLAHRKILDIRSIMLLLSYLLFFAFLGHQRMLFFALIVTTGFTLVRHRKMKAQLMLSIGLLMVFLSIPMVVDYLSDPLNLASLRLRVREMQVLLRFMGENPAALLWGMGYPSPLGEKGFSEIFFPGFYPGDLGWLGLLGQYGGVGLGLVLGLHAFETVRVYRISVLRRAIKDFLMMYWVNLLGGAFVQRIGMFVILYAINMYLGNVDKMNLRWKYRVDE